MTQAAVYFSVVVDITDEDADRWFSSQGNDDEEIIEQAVAKLQDEGANNSWIEDVY